MRNSRLLGQLSFFLFCLIFHVSGQLALTVDSLMNANRNQSCWSEWSFCSNCGTTVSRRVCRISTFCDGNPENECTSEEETRECPQCNDNNNNTSAMECVVIVFAMVTVFLFFVLVICIISTRRARRRVITEARRQMLEQSRLENSLGLPSDPGFLNDSEVDNILRQMPPPPPKYEEIPSGFTTIPTAPCCSQWPNTMEVELPPRYEEILIEPLQLSVVELGRDTISEVHTAERPIAQVVSSIPPVVETDSATSISGNESDNPQTRSNVNSGSFANSAFEIP